jgi:hypothetical protein
MNSESVIMACYDLRTMLKHIATSRRLVAASLAVSIVAGCGVKGPLVPAPKAAATAGAPSPASPVATPPATTPVAPAATPAPPADPTDVPRKP